MDKVTVRSVFRDDKACRSAEVLISNTIRQALFLIKHDHHNDGKSLMSYNLLLIAHYLLLIQMMVRRSERVGAVCKTVA